MALIFLRIVYIVLHENHCILYIATCKWPLALCCSVIDWLKQAVQQNAQQIAVMGVRGLQLIDL